MDFAAIAAWWNDAVSRADWIAVIASALATVLSAVVAALIALRIQNRDFQQRLKEAAAQNERDAQQRQADLETRKSELEQQAAAEARQRRDDWRRTITSKAMDVIDEAALLGADPYSRSANEARTKNRIYSVQMELRLDPEPGADEVSNWFRRRALELMIADPNPASRNGMSEGLSARMRSALAEWAAGRQSSDSFSGL